MEFREFPKIARFNREVIVTEKIDGTNAQVHVLDDGRVFAGSRNRYLTTEKTKDNFGFAAWVKEHEDELRGLGPGRHYGEWWGSGIQRGYGLPAGERRFSLFNVGLWVDTLGSREDKKLYAPACCRVVPTLYEGAFNTDEIQRIVLWLDAVGSKAAPGFKPAEGVVVFHRASGTLFKKTIHNDEVPKGAKEAA